MPDFEKMSDAELLKLLGRKTQQPISETAKGLGLKAAEGLTFGASSAALPATYAGVGKALEYLKGVPKEYQTPFKELYSEGRKEYKNIVEPVEKEHPVMSFGAELAGGVPLAFGAAKTAVTKGVPLIKKMLSGAKLGTKYGAAYGTGSNIAPAIETDNVAKGAETIAKGAAKGAAGGAAGGFAIPAIASPVLERAIPPIKRLVKSMFGKQKSIASEDIVKAVSQDKPLVNPTEIVNEKIKPELIEQSIKENKPLISLGGSKTAKLALTAKLNNEKAADILGQHASETMSGQPIEVESIINKHFGDISPADNMLAIKAKYKAEAAPLYDKAMAHGEVENYQALKPALTGEEKTLTAAEKSIKKYINIARNSELGIELEGLPDNHIKVLDAAKQKMDDAISKLQRAGESNEARAVINLKNNMLNTLDNEVKSYGQARKVASDDLSLMEAQENATKFLKGESAESIKQKIKDYTPPEQEAFILGMRQELLNDLFNKSKTGKTNVAQGVFGDSESSMVRRKLQTVLGKERYDDLMKDINPLVKHGQNIGELMGGSQTAEKLGYKIRGGQSLVKRQIGKALEQKTAEPYEIIAKMLTDPKYLAENIGNYKASKITELLYQTPKTGGLSGGIIGGEQ